MKSLEQERDEAASEKYEPKFDVRHQAFCDGFDHAVRVLAERGPEFDDRAAEKALADYMNNGSGQNPEYIMRPDHKAYFLARWQHAQDAAYCAAKDAEITWLKEKLFEADQNIDVYAKPYREAQAKLAQKDAANAEMSAELSYKDAEIERLRAALEWISAGYKGGPKTGAACQERATKALSGGKGGGA